MKKNKKTQEKILNIILIIYVILILLLIINAILNQFIFTKTYTLKYENLPDSFNNYKIVQITDVHSVRSEKQGNKIIEQVKKASPNVIFITGDLIDSNFYKSEQEKYNKKFTYKVEKYTINFLKELTQISTVYYIYGNHEVSLYYYKNTSFTDTLNDLGIKFLNNKIDYIYNGNEKIKIIGLIDPSCLKYEESYKDLKGTNQEKLFSIYNDINTNQEENCFSILLLHRPDFYPSFTSSNINLVLSGHTHGGIIRLPIIRGLYATNQGLFPKYSYGLYQENSTDLIIGAGIGYSGNVHLRIFDFPEISSITLTK